MLDWLTEGDPVPKQTSKNNPEASNLKNFYFAEKETDVAKVMNVSNVTAWPGIGTLLALFSVPCAPHFCMPASLVAAKEGRISVKDFIINSKTGNVQNETPDVPKIASCTHQRILRGALIL